MGFRCRYFVIKENQLLSLFVKKMKMLGLDIFTNVYLHNTEIDAVVFEYIDGRRPYVHLFEVKARAKLKVIDQIERRRELADYLYVVIPYNIYPWIIRRVRDDIGIVIYINGEFYLFRKPRYIGNGDKFLSIARIDKIKNSDVIIVLSYDDSELR